MSKAPQATSPSSGEMTAEEKTLLATDERVIECGLTNFVEVGSALLEISDKRLYRDGFGTFQEYCKTRWAMTARRAYQLIDAAEAMKSVPENVKCISHFSSVAAGALSATPQPDRAAVAQEAAAEAAKEGKPVAARHVKAAAQKRQPAGPMPTKSRAKPTDVEAAKTEVKIALEDLSQLQFDLDFEEIKVSELKDIVAQLMRTAKAIAAIYGHATEAK